MSEELKAKRARMKEIALERIWRGALTPDERTELDKIDAALATQKPNPPAPVTGAASGPVAKK
jgi:hypothetical protein